MLKCLVVLAASTLLFSSPALGSALSAKNQKKLEAYKTQLEAEEGEGDIKTIPPTEEGEGDIKTIPPNDISSTTTDPLTPITTTLFPPEISSGPTPVVNPQSQTFEQLYNNIMRQLANNGNKITFTIDNVETANDVLSLWNGGIWKSPILGLKIVTFRLIKKRTKKAIFSSKIYVEITVVCT